MKILSPEEIKEEFNQLNNNDDCLSEIQKEQLIKPCPICGSKCLAVGDLSDFNHDIVICNNNNCRFALMYNGDLINR